MAGPFTRRADWDPTNIRQWLAGRGAGTVGARTAPRATPGPPPVNDAPEPSQRLEISSPQDQSRHFVLEADNSPDPAEPMSVPAVTKPEPKKAENCGHCGKPLPTLRSAGAEYCTRYCAKAARKARATELPRYYRDA
jgi:hypothetical protein